MASFFTSLFKTKSKAPQPKYRCIQNDSRLCCNGEHKLICGHVVSLRPAHPCGGSCANVPKPETIDECLASSRFEKRNGPKNLDHHYLDEPFLDEEFIPCHICILRRWEESFYYCLLNANLIGPNGAGFVWLVKASEKVFLEVPHLKSDVMAEFRYNGSSGKESGGETPIEIWEQYKARGDSYLNEIGRRIRRELDCIAQEVEESAPARGLQRDVGQGKAAREQAKRLEEPWIPRSTVRGKGRNV